MTFSWKILFWSLITFSSSDRQVNLALNIASLKSSGVFGTLPFRPSSTPSDFSLSDFNLSIRWCWAFTLRSEDHSTSAMHHPRTRYSFLFGFNSVKGFGFRVPLLSSHTGTKSSRFSFIASHRSSGVKVSILKVKVHSWAYIRCMLRMALSKLILSCEPSAFGCWNTETKS